MTRGGEETRMRSRNRTARRRRVDRTGRELLLLMAFVMAVSVAALALADAAEKPAAQPLPATVSVKAPSRDLPADLAAREVRVEELNPLPFRELVGRIAGLVGIEAVLEERPGRVAGERVVHDAPVPFGLVMTGTAPAVLDELARLSGYDWSWADGRLVFFRHADSEQREAMRLPSGVAVDLLAALAESGASAAPADATRAEGTAEPGPQSGTEASEDGEVAHAEVDPAGRLAPAVPGRVEAGPGRRVDAGAHAAVEGQGEAPAAEQVGAGPAGWEVDPDRHETVEGVLRAWAARAGWNLAWETDRQFRVGAAAAFEGGGNGQEGFLKAADALLAIAPMRRMLTATAYPNRWLVVRDVGSVDR